jgi:hypothetical protein
MMTTDKSKGGSTMKTYSVTRQFTSGPLAGLTHTQTTTVPMAVGFKCEKPIGGSPYVITSCVEVIN